MDPLRRSRISAVLLAAMVGAGACDLVSQYMSVSPEDQLANAAVSRWAAQGQPFLDGASGQDTVASVKATGARSWEVATVPTAGGSPSVWSLEVTRAEVYPVFRGDDFARWLGQRARELGMHTFLPPEAAGPVRSGQIQAVGDLEIRYGRAEDSGRNTESRVAYRRPGADGGDPRWEIQPRSRSSTVLLDMLKTVSEDMIYNDERVQTCMGSVTPRGVARSEQLSCVADVLNQQFGPGV